MVQAEGTPDVPDMGRRQFMNLLTFGTVTGVALGALYPVVNYFIPPSSGGAGGSGVVILRMATASYSGTTSGSPSVTTSGSDTILTFTGSGTYTA